MSRGAGDNSPLALFPLLVEQGDFGKIHEVHSRWCDKISTAWHDMISKKGWHLGEANLKLRLPFFANELLGSAHLHGPLGLVALAEWLSSQKETNDHLQNLCQAWKLLFDRVKILLASGHHLGFLPTPAVRFGEGTLPVSIFVSHSLRFQKPCQLQAEQQSVCLACSRRPGAAWVTQKCKNNVGWRIWLTWSLIKAISDIGFQCQSCKKQPILPCELHHAWKSLAPCQVANSLLLLGIFLILDKGYTADKVVLEITVCSPSLLTSIHQTVHRWCALSICKAHLFQHASCDFQLPSWMLPQIHGRVGFKRSVTYHLQISSAFLMGRNWRQSLISHADSLMLSDCCLAHLDRLIELTELAPSLQHFLSSFVEKRPNIS